MEAEGRQIMEFQSQTFQGLTQNSSELRSPVRLPRISRATLSLDSRRLDVGTKVLRNLTRQNLVEMNGSIRGNQQPSNIL
jgi:hypothetical protein